MNWEKITRLEVINHGVASEPIGRLLTLWNVRVEPSVQDGGHTLKIFIVGEGRGHE